MDRDPSVYVILSLNTHLEVDYTTVHLFDRQGAICGTQVREGLTHEMPLDALDACLKWGADALNDYYQNGEVTAFG